jgi:DNA replication regulator DPB11
MLTLEVIGRFSEATYVVSNPRPERRAATDIALANDLPQPSTAPVSSSIPAASGKRASTRPGTPAGSLPPGVEEEDELVSVRRVPAETLQVWESVLRPRGFVLAEGRLQRSPSKSQSQPPTSPRSAGTLPARAMTLQNLTGARMSALQGLSRVKSFAPMSKDISTPKQLFRKQASKPSDDSSSFFGGIRAREEAENNGVGPTGQHAEVNMVPNEPQVPAIQGAVPQRSSPKTANAEAGPSNPRTAFAGVRFHLLGEARCDNVKKGIEDAGGWVHDQITDADFIIIRLVRFVFLLLEDIISN